MIIIIIKDIKDFGKFYELIKDEIRAEKICYNPNRIRDSRGRLKKGAKIAEKGKCNLFCRMICQIGESSGKEKGKHYNQYINLHIFSTANPYIHHRMVKMVLGISVWYIDCICLCQKFYGADD